MTQLFKKAHAAVDNDTSLMTAARIYGPRDLRIDSVPHPGQPGPEQALLRVTAVGICGSDLHTYMDGRIGDTTVQEPLILGHEFGAVVEAVGEKRAGRQP